MTQLEQKFMEVVPSAMRRIAEALEGINEKLELLTEQSKEPDSGPIQIAEESSDGTRSEGGTQNDMRADPIVKVINEIERIEKEEFAGRHKIGYSARVHTTCKSCDLMTVGDLLDIGYRYFCKMRNMGKSSANYVTKALENLYGITEW